MYLVGNGLLQKNTEQHLKNRFYSLEKFLGTHRFPDTHGLGSRKVYSFFIDRMCASILCKSSRKQELNGKTIDKLMRCVTGFDSFVSMLLRGNDDYVDLFVDQMLSRYWDLKKLSSPDIAVLFVKTMLELTMEEYEKKGRIWGTSTDVRKKAFKQDEVKRTIKKEISEVRLDAVKALYNSAVRDKKILNKERMKQIQVCLTDQQMNNDDDDDAVFKSQLFKLVDLAESTNEIDYANLFSVYLNLLNGDSTKNIEAIINFLNNQAKDGTRSQQLFTEQAIAKLIGVLGGHSVYSNEVKEDIVTIINSYLEHELTIGLSEININTLLHHTLEPKEPDVGVVNAALVSILLLVEKGRLLPHGVLKRLISHFDLLCSNKESKSNDILFIVSRALLGKTGHLNDPADLERLSTKLNSDQVVELDAETKRIKFKKQSDTNNSFTLISLLAAKVIAKSVEHEVMISKLRKRKFVNSALFRWY